MATRSADNDDLADLVEAGRDGAILRVHVRPGSRRRGVLGTHGGMLSVGTGAPPEGGKATKEALEVLARWLGVPRSRLSVVSGRTARSKRIGVVGETPESLRKDIARRLSR